MLWAPFAARCQNQVLPGWSKQRIVLRYEHGCDSSLVAFFLSAPSSAQRTIRRWPWLAASRVLHHRLILDLGVHQLRPVGRQRQKWLNRAATCNGALPTESRWSISFDGDKPPLSFTSGFRGYCSNFSSRTRLLPLDAKITISRCSASGEESSKSTNWTPSGTEAETSSAISPESSCRKDLCVNRCIEMPDLAAKVCFTTIAVLPSHSSASRTTSVSPEARKHSSIAAAIWVRGTKAKWLQQYYTSTFYTFYAHLWTSGKWHHWLHWLWTTMSSMVTASDLLGIQLPLSIYIYMT